MSLQDRRPARCAQPFALALLALALLLQGSQDARAGKHPTSLARHTSIISKSSLRAPHSGQVQFTGTSSQRVPGAIPSSGRPSASL